jgi:hypothetical protein
LAKIIIVHGISNQFRGESELLAAWHPALVDGLRRAAFAGSAPLPGDCFCPFYGDLFRPSGHLSAGKEINVEDLAEANAADIGLLEAVWRSAAATDPEVPGPEEYGETLFRAPRIAERALNSLAKSKFLARHVPLQFFGDLKQVSAYLDDPYIRAQASGRVLNQIGPDTKLVIGHSLGSVVAYEALCRKSGAATDLLTIGSPLGIRNVVFDKLIPRPGPDEMGHWPASVRHWTNIAAAGDIVAAQKELAPLFGTQLVDLRIDSGWDAHNSTRYLNTLEAGKAIAHALS